MTSSRIFRLSTFAACLAGWAAAAFADPVDLAGNDLVVDSQAALSADGYTNSSSTLATLTLAFDDDCTAPEISGNLRLVKCGTGTVTFAAKQTYSGGTVVSNGFIGVTVACDVNGIGTSTAADGILLAGGGLSFAKRTSGEFSINRGLRVSPGTTGVIRNLPGSHVINLDVHNVDFRNATLALERYGDGNMATFTVTRGSDNGTWASTGLATGGTMTVRSNVILYLWNGDTFGGANHQTDITLRVCSGGYVNVSSAHSPLTRNVILEGGATLCSTDVSKGSPSAVRVENIVQTGTWKSLDLCGRVTVCRGETNAPACLRVQNAHLAPLTADAVFDVQEGAVFEVDSQLWPANGKSGRSLRKVGPGKLLLKRPLTIGGTLYVDEGTVELAPHVMLGDVSDVIVRDGARLVLGDGSLWNKTPEQPLIGFMTTADIWFDATKLTATNSQSVSSVRNLGAAGGNFVAFDYGSPKKPGVPTFVTNGIAGKPSLYFAGGSSTSDDTPQALLLRAYTNTTDRLTMYIVFKWDGWTDDDSRSYMWHGPVSFGWTGATEEDNNVPGSFDIQYGAKFAEAKFCYGGLKTTAAPGLDGTPTAANALLFKTERNGLNAVCGTWWTDAYSAFRTKTLDCSAQPQLNVNLVNLGGRLHGWSNANTDRMLKGWIGEMVAFSRALTDDERTYVESYLKRKWFASTTPAVDDPTHPQKSRVEVSVASGSGTMGFYGQPNVQRMEGVELKATGEGKLSLISPEPGFGEVDVSDGTLRLDGAVSSTSEATLWMDASDAATVVTDEDGKVVSVRNKGNLGGAFAQCPKSYYGGKCPLPTQTNINGLAALRFDSNSGLGISCPCADNQGTRRKFVVYGVMRRDRYEHVGGKGRWGAAFSFSTTNTAEWGTTDNNIPGSFLPMENLKDNDDPSSGIVVMNGSRITGTVKYPIADGTPYLFSTYAMDRDVAYGYETVVAENVMSNVIWSCYVGGDSASLAPMSYNYLLLGGRLAGQYMAQWHSKDNSANRMWEGSIGEFIVFDRQLSQTRLGELAAYLRKKWFGVGTGSATPPAWLVGATEAVPQAAVKVSAGGVLEMSGDTVSVGDLTLADGATIRRLDAVTDPEKFALFDVTGLLSVAGSQTLSATAFPKGEVRFITADEVTQAAGVGWARNGAKTGPLNVMQREDGLWYIRNGFLFSLR